MVSILHSELAPGTSASSCYLLTVTASCLLPPSCLLPMSCLQWSAIDYTPSCILGYRPQALTAWSREWTTGYWWLLVCWSVLGLSRHNTGPLQRTLWQRSRRSRRSRSSRRRNMRIHRSRRRPTVALSRSPGLSWPMHYDARVLELLLWPFSMQIFLGRNFYISIL